MREIQLLSRDERNHQVDYQKKKYQKKNSRTPKKNFKKKNPELKKFFQKKKSNQLFFSKTHPHLSGLTQVSLLPITHSVILPFFCTSPSGMSHSSSPPFLFPFTDFFFFINRSASIVFWNATASYPTSLRLQ